MEAAVQKALPSMKAFKDVDEPTIDYISSMVAEEKAIKSAAHLTTLLTDLLVSYEVIQKESEANKICEELFEKLVKAGVCKAPVVAPKPAAGAATTAAAVAPSGSPSSSSSSSTLLTLAPPTHSLIAPQGHRWIVATEKLRARLQVGMEVLGRWKKDLKWYPCRIEKINEDGSFVIRVPEYTSEQQTVELAYIKLLEKISYLSADIEAELREGGWKIGSNQADRLSEWDGATENAASAFENGGAFEVKKLAQAIVIGEFGITAAERADAALHASLIAEKIASKKIFSKKELREKKKAELEVKKEAARAKALEQKKFEALKRYLAADKNGKPTDVEIQGVQLSTPDGSQELLNGATLKFVCGRRYGLIGRNGVGKTSLMRAISGYDLPDFPVHLRVVHVEQEVQGDEMSVIESVLAADIERTMLLEEERKLMRSLKSEEVAAAKAQADQKEASEKSAREKLKSDRQRKMVEEEAESAKRLGASVDQMLDNMRELDAELDELDDGADLPDDYSAEPASSTDAGSDDEEADADLARMEAEAKAAEEEDDEDDEDDGEERKTGGKSKSKRGKVNKTARDAARRKEREVQLPQTLIVDPTTRLTQIYARMNEIDAWGAEARARQILTGLQFSVVRQQGKTRDLSGGWRQRVSLAQALFVNPDILLLDEPTNHLDFPAVLWLEEYLRKYEKTLIIVSHDRSFLNNVITDTIHYYQKQLNYYRGNYDMFEKVRADKMKQMKREFDAQKAKRAHIQSFIDKFRCSASRAALVQSRIKALAKMDALIDVVEEHQTTFSFPEPDRIDGPILQCTNLKFGYHYNKILLDKVTVNVDMDSRIGVIGANGTGKTTLINLLVSKLQPISGSVSRNGSARIAVFAQHHVDGLDLRLSAVDFLCSIFPGNNAQIFRRHLGCFGITGDLATNPMRNLSGGQKSRVAFSVVTWKKPHVIILDEPTNHLDLETIDALIHAIQNFGGGCLFVSHDQNFLRSVGNEYWGVSNGTVKRFDTFEATKKFSYAASSM